MRLSLSPASRTASTPPPVRSPQTSKLPTSAPPRSPTLPRTGASSAPPAKLLPVAVGQRALFRVAKAFLSAKSLWTSPNSPPRLNRSEEHTSELQSRQYLV